MKLRKIFLLLLCALCGQNAFPQVANVTLDANGMVKNTAVKFDGTSHKLYVNGVEITGTGGGVPDFGDLTNIPTTLAGYGITDAQPLINFAGRKIITVSKGAAATDTRTGLSVYDTAKPFATIAAAMAAATAGDVVFVEAGTYEQTAGLNVPHDVSLIGAGRDQTVIQNGDASSGTDSGPIYAIVAPGNNSTIADLTIKGTAPIRGDGTRLYQAPLGAGSNDKQFVGAVVRNVHLVGDSDGVYIRRAPDGPLDNTNLSTMKLFDCLIETAYDNIVLRSGSTVEAYNCTQVTAGGSKVSLWDGTATGVGCTASNATARVFGGTITVSGGTAHNFGAFANANSGARVELAGVQLDVSGTGAYDLSRTSGSISVANVARADRAPLTSSGTITYSPEKLNSLALSGDISAPAWTTTGLRLFSIPATLTDLTSSGTVPITYTNRLGGNTIAASNATTFTYYVNTWLSAPTAGSQVTITNPFAFGADSFLIGTPAGISMTYANDTLTLTNATQNLIYQNIGTGSTRALTLQNNTEATNGAPAQNSPGFALQGRGWRDTGGGTGVSEIAEWRFNTIPAASTGHADMKLRIEGWVNNNHSGNAPFGQIELYKSGGLAVGSKAGTDPGDGVSVATVTTDSLVKTGATAYAPIFGGTTTTSPLQSGTAGTSGQVLKSNGASALPTFQTLGTSATVDTGTTSGTIPLLGTGGYIPTARLGSGTANSSSFLRGDQSWTAVTVPTIATTPSVLKGDNAGNAVAATAGTDYVKPTTTTTYTAGVTQQFTADASKPGLAFGGVTADPSSASGGVWLRTDTPALKYNDGTATRTVANLSQAQTFTNKTIDKASNTLTGVAATGANTDITSLAANVALTTPKITTGINDANGNPMLAFTATASAVDGFTFTNAATANPATVTMSATGSDTNVHIKLTPKGTGAVITGSGLATTPAFILGTGTTDGWYAAGPGQFTWSGSSTGKFNFIAKQLRVASDAIIRFGDNADVTAGSLDSGIARNAAGVVEINNGTAGMYRDLKVRQHYVDQTITAGGTTGVQTINKAAGTVNFAAADTSKVVNNSLVTANSTIYCSVRTNDTTAYIKNVVPGSGSFTITLGAAATAETSVGFFVVN